MKAAYVAVALLAGACNAPEPGHEPTAQNGPPLSGARRLGMRTCPSAVVNARTTQTPTPDGVDVTITSSDPAAMAQIVARAQMHAAFGESLSALPPHTGMHSGPGKLGFCPIIHAQTIVTGEHLTDGVRLHVHAVNSAAVRDLQNATRERIQSMQQPAS